MTFSLRHLAAIRCTNARSIVVQILNKNSGAVLAFFWNTSSLRGSFWTVIRTSPMLALKTGRMFPMSLGYAAWETDEVIAEELYRNLGLAVICIFATTLLLVGQTTCSVLVLLMVIMALAEVGGFMHFWGLTIDTVSCINLIIAMGLCVDYSAHIAHR